MSNFLETATQIGELVEQKNSAYGSSFADSGKFLRLLYPEGVLPAQYDDALLLVRIFDKLKRIATDNDPSGESPYRDIAGYGILGAHLREQKKYDKEGVSECTSGSASLEDAITLSKATLGSVPQHTSTPTTTHAETRREKKSERAIKSALKHSSERLKRVSASNANLTSGKIAAADHRAKRKGA